MFEKKYLLSVALVALIVLVAVALGACTGDEGAQGPPGPVGPAGPQGPPPSAEDVEAAVREIIAPGASDASMAAGGRLYDKWWKEDAGTTEPTADQALWSLQTTNTRSGSDTSRCKECHGWDYKGAGGAYASGSHYTGFTGVYRAGATMSEDDLIGALSGATDYRHDFSGALSENALENLADFLKYGLINDTRYIDYGTKAAINADAANGQALYDQACSACHGADGRLILFGGEDGVADIADGNPWEFIHKVRAGQPGTEMPSAIEDGWSTQDVVDVLGYAQTLPTE